MRRMLPGRTAARTRGGGVAAATAAVMALRQRRQAAMGRLRR